MVNTNTVREELELLAAEIADDIAECAREEFMAKDDYFCLVADIEYKNWLEWKQDSKAFA
ncbi:MAG: hypothetical protein ACO3Q6_08295 [Ilumatobacteraceae bacterium]